MAEFTINEADEIDLEAGAPDCVVLVSRGLCVQVDEIRARFAAKDAGRVSWIQSLQSYPGNAELDLRNIIRLLEGVV